MKIEERTVTSLLESSIDFAADTIEDIKTEICEEYCRYPHEASSQKALDAICADCPMEKL